MLKALRHIFSDLDEARGEEIGKGISKLLFDEKHREVVRYFSHKQGLDEKELSLKLSCGYIICYRMITRTNAFHIKRRFIEAGEHHLIKYLLQANLKEYMINKSPKIFTSNFNLKLSRLNSKYKDVSGSRHKALKRVVEAISSELLRDQENLKKEKDFREFILNSLQQKITVIQDFLIDYSIF